MYFHYLKDLCFVLFLVVELTVVCMHVHVCVLPTCFFWYLYDFIYKIWIFDPLGNYLNVYDCVFDSVEIIDVLVHGIFLVK